MGLIARGYGSEWHLLRFLGRHRAYFTKLIEAETGLTAVKWSDFGFALGIDEKNGFGDSELKGLDFLPLDHPARAAWSGYWPQTGNTQNWDAVGIGRAGDALEEWLLVEAKANIQELRSECGANPRGGLSLIEQRLAETQAAIGISPVRDWARPYYQYANRLALLRFLVEQGVNARLLFLYFSGDKHPSATCPRDAHEWAQAISEMRRVLGLPERHILSARIHSLVVPVIA